MKVSFPLLALSMAIFIQPVQADMLSDSEQIMNDAQKVYSNFFPSNQTTQTLGPYLYRYYPSTEVFLGINQESSSVYVLGGLLGDDLLYIDQVKNVKVLLSNQLAANNNTNGQQAICDTLSIPDGFSYHHESNTTFVSTNGQCIQAPENYNICNPIPDKDTNNQAIATNIQVLTSTSISNIVLSGINFLGIDDIISQEFEKNKTCVIHAPTELTNHTVNLDICIDITNKFDDFLSRIPGASPPFTTHLTGLSNSTRVDDCFRTNAASIVNLVTKELWIKENGSFIKSN